MVSSYVVLFRAAYKNTGEQQFLPGVANDTIVPESFSAMGREELSSVSSSITASGP